MAKTAKKTKTNGKAAAKKTATRGAKKAAPRAAKKTARKPNAAFMKPVTPSPDLAAVVGAKPIPRTEVTKKLWAYIKKNGLQDAEEQAHDQGRRRAQDRVRRQGGGEHVRDDEAGRQAPEVARRHARCGVSLAGPALLPCRPWSRRPIVRGSAIAAPCEQPMPVLPTRPARAGRAGRALPIQQVSPPPHSSSNESTVRPGAPPGRARGGRRCPGCYNWADDVRPRPSRPDARRGERRSAPAWRSSPANVSRWSPTSRAGMSRRVSNRRCATAGQRSTRC